MHSTSATPSAPVTGPSQARQINPSASQAAPQRHTTPAEMAPDGIGRARRNCRSKSASNASFKNIPPTYRNVVPASRKGSFLRLPPPLSHQPARQLDQIVGRFETRPRTSNVRRSDMEDFYPGLAQLSTFLRQTALRQPGQSPVVFGSELVHDIAIFEFRRQDFPGVRLHFELRTQPGICGEQIH